MTRDKQVIPAVEHEFFLTNSVTFSEDDISLPSIISFNVLGSATQTTYTVKNVNGILERGRNLPVLSMEKSYC
jgi:hypothetical protein